MASRLTKKQITAVLRYDSESGGLYWKKTLSNRAVAGSKAGTVRKDGYLRVTVFGKGHYVHSLVFLICKGRWPRKGACLDHRNGNPSDNRIRNLREATGSQNQFNRGKQINNTSGFKGVSRVPSGRWVARINVCKYLGIFETPQAAAAAYRRAVSVLAGEFMRAA